MAEFDDLRLQLQQARVQKEQAATGVLLTGERLRQLDDALARAERALNPDDPAQAAEYDALSTARAQAEIALGRQRTMLAGAIDAAAGAFAAFEPFTDPRDAVTRMGDDVPFLLLPVRLETRFGRGPTGAPQLWVRVYPDDCSIDTFEPELSEAEVAGAREYWIGIWRAGGVEAGERAAWRGLVGGFGSGRSAWIEQTYRPLNEGDRPAKGSPEEVILAIPTDAPPEDWEMEPLRELWTAVWYADGDPAQEADAYANFEGQVGDPDRAAALVAAYRPANLDEDPPAPLARADVGVQAAFVVFPPPADVATRVNSWSRAPKVAAFPDRFVLIAYRGGVPRVEVGRAIPTPLVAGIDPGAAPGEGLRQEPDGEVVIPEEMRWMTDFDRAVEVGMGFRLNLSAGEATGGFDRLLVLGVRSSDDPETARRELETLLHHHRHTRTGFTLLPQGVPTNNT